MENFKYYYDALAEHHLQRKTFLTDVFWREYNALLDAFAAWRAY